MSYLYVLYHVIGHDDGHVNDSDDDDDDDDDDAVDENAVTNDKCDKHESENVNMSDPRKASAEILRRDQRSDRSLLVVS